jgi:hypothetical protein
MMDLEQIFAARLVVMVLKITGLTEENHVQNPLYGMLVSRFETSILKYESGVPTPLTRIWRCSTVKNAIILRRFQGEFGTALSNVIIV